MKVRKGMEPGSLQRYLMGDNGYKLKTKKEVQRKFFVMKTDKQSNRLPRKVLPSSPSEVFKTRQEKAQSNLVWSHSLEQEVELETV